jgi:hypothetical protein
MCVPHTVSDNALSSFSVLSDGINGMIQEGKVITHNNTGEVGIKHSAIFIVTPMDLQEVRPKILYDGFVIIGTFTKRSNAGEKGNQKHLFWLCQ